MKCILGTEVAIRYTNGISDSYIKPYIPLNYNSSWAQYSILIPNSIHRKEIIKTLKEKDIPVMIYYKILITFTKSIFNFWVIKMVIFPISEKYQKVSYPYPCIRI